MLSAVRVCVWLLASLHALADEPPTESCDAEGGESEPSIFEDAELYLHTLGLETDVPALKVQYPAEFYPVNGSKTTYQTGGKFLETVPRLYWTSATPQSKHSVLMINPDAPRRVGDGTTAGTEGPWMHWLVVNCGESVDSGYTFIKYEAPRALYGTQRYIVILFEQLSPGSFPPNPTKRMSWDMAGYLKLNEGKLRVKAWNFFYVKNSKKA